MHDSAVDPVQLHTPGSCNNLDLSSICDVLQACRHMDHLSAKGVWRSMTALFSLYEVAGFSMPETRGVLPWPWLLTLNLSGAGVTVSSSPDCTYKGVISSDWPQSHLLQDVLKGRLLRTVCASSRCCMLSAASGVH